MIGPEERRVYSECLLAPPGFRFDHGIATTFTLDLDTLLTLPFTLAMQSAPDPEALLVDRVALLQSLRATTERLSVFHQRGHLAVPRKHGVFFGLLEDCVLPVVARHPAGIFHPKLWLLRFVDEERVLLRAMVLSRNLSSDRSWDLALVLEGEPQRRPVKLSRDLAELVAELPELVTDEKMSDARRELVASLAEEVARTEFAPPEPFDRREPARFHTIGLRNKSFSPTLRGNGVRVLCLSPFLSASSLAKARALAPSAELVSRDDQLAKMSDAALSEWSCKVLAEAASTDETSDDATSDDYAKRVPSMSLHAKALIVEDRMSHVIWWVGSANLTDAAWEGRNVELMVELHGTSKFVGIDRVTEGGFLALCSPWEREEQDPSTAAHAFALERAEAVRNAIVRSDLRLEASAEDDVWNVALCGAPAEGEGVCVWPVSLPETHHAKPFVGVPSWLGVTTVSLTSIVAFEVKVKHEGTVATVRFALKLPTDGFPEDRDAHVLRHIVDSQAGFFRYLRLLLAEGEGHVGLPGLLEGVSSEGTDGRASGGRTVFDEIVLEDLVRTLSRDPQRLDAVDRVVRDLAATPEGAALVPPEFSELWRLIRAVKEPS